VLYILPGLPPACPEENRRRGLLHHEAGRNI